MLQAPSPNSVFFLLFILLSLPLLLLLPQFARSASRASLLLCGSPSFALSVLPPEFSWVCRTQMSEEEVLRCATASTSGRALLRNHSIASGRGPLPPPQAALSWPWNSLDSTPFIQSQDKG